MHGIDVLFYSKHAAIPLTTIALKNWFSPAISFGFTALHVAFS